MSNMLREEVVIKKLILFFRYNSNSREEKCQHKWRNLISIYWVSQHFLVWRVSVSLMFIFICLRIVLAGSDIKLTLYLRKKGQWKCYFAFKRLNLIITCDSWRNWRKPRRHCLLIDIRIPACRIWSRCAISPPRHSVIMSSLCLSFIICIM
jgi:hypothetical protein